MDRCIKTRVVAYDMTTWMLWHDAHCLVLDLNVTPQGASPLIGLSTCGHFSPGHRGPPPPRHVRPRLPLGPLWATGRDREGVECVRSEDSSQLHVVVWCVLEVVFVVGNTYVLSSKLSARVCYYSTCSVLCYCRLFCESFIGKAKYSV